MFKALALALGLVLTCSCTQANPAFCSLDTDCQNGFRCDDSHSCVEVVLECQTNPDCADTARPICDNNTCRACTVDPECSSTVCRPDGACELADNVIYVSPGGPESGECSIERPCDLGFAKSKLTATRSTIRLTPGSYTLTREFLVDSTPAIVVGDRTSVVKQANVGPSFHVSSGSSLSLRGFAAETGIACDNATLSISDLNLDHPTSEIRSWIVGANCEVSVSGSELIASRQHGIAVTGGTLAVVDTRIANSQGSGLSCSNSTCSVNRTSILGSLLVGLDATPVSLELHRSLLTGNLQGGVRSVGGTLDVTNNFVFRNGNSKDATFGGMRLEPANGSNRIQHNTIVFNDSDPFASPLLAGGLFCKFAGASNNLIYNNFSGNNTMPNSQTGGGCDFTGSLIVNGDGTNEMHFVSPIAEPFDYHLADELSPAVNSGLPGTVTEDFDGDPRTSSPDIGADEFVR